MIKIKSITIKNVLYYFLFHVLILFSSKGGINKTENYRSKLIALFAVPILFLLPEYIMHSYNSLNELIKRSMGNEFAWILIILYMKILFDNKAKRD